MVDGAPTDGALAAAFEAVRSKVLAAAAPTEADGGIVDRFLAHLRGLVQVRNLNEMAGDDPQALASRIQADSRRGDVSGALAAFAKLPETVAPGGLGLGGRRRSEAGGRRGPSVDPRDGGRAAGRER